VENNILENLIWEKKKMKCVNSLFVLIIAGIASVSFAAVNFDNLSLSSESYWNGSDFSGGFTSGNASFNNTFTDWGYGVTSWEGWAYSNKSDNLTAGYGNQYSTITGSAQSGSNYSIGFVGWYGLPSMTFSSSQVVEGFYVTNTTYVYYAMLNGEGPANKFDSSDWFKLTIIGLNELNASVGSIDFYLASEGNIVNDWEYVNLSTLGAVKSLQFSLSSSDNDPHFGMNTPAYFAMDTVIPEPATMILISLGGLLLGRKGR
jgi:hypothetical protein